MVDGLLSSQAERNRCFLGDMMTNGWSTEASKLGGLLLLLLLMLLLFMILVVEEEEELLLVVTMVLVLVRSAIGICG